MRQVEAQSSVVLMPVLEVAPFHFSSRPLPVGPARGHPGLWAEYFQLCMTDAGFTDVVPIADGLHFVAARRLIGNPLLDRLVREAVEGTDLVAEQIPHLCGGFALFADGCALIEPSCCADLENLESWSELVRGPQSSGTIWVGHPPLGFSIDGQRVTLTEQWEYQPAPDYLVQVTVPLDQLTAAVAHARVELELFRAELLPVVTRVLGSPRRAKKVVDRLVGQAARPRRLKSEGTAAH